jgi:HlyD family secretion protein
MTRKKKVIIGVGVVVVLGAVAFANFKFKRTEGVTVNTEAVKQRKLEAIVSSSGKIQAKRFVNISADTSGRVTELVVNEGDRVKEGQFLLQIDPRNLRTRVQSGEASLGAAQSTAEQLRLALESSRTQLKLAQDNYRREQELMKGGLTTRQQFERAESELRVREQDLRAQEQNVQTQQQRMRQEQATLENAKTDLSKVRIESPINGVVTRRNVELGETAVVGTMNNAGTVLLVIADMSVIEAEVEVDETDIPSVKLGQPAKITIDAMPGKTFTGKVTEIGNSPIQSAGNTQAGTQATNFKVTVTVDGEIPEVRPGFTCTAEITTATRDNVLAVPIQATTVREMVVDEKGAIVREPVTAGAPPRRAGGLQAAELKPGQERKEIEGVFVVRDGKAVFEAVKTGIAGEKFFEVLSGLKDGDSVVVGPFSSVRQLADGAAVKVEAAPRTTGAPASQNK